MGKIAEKTGCKMLLAQKAFSNYDCYHLLEPYLAGTEASGLYEARLGAQEMPGKEVHVFCAGYREDEFEELLSFADHIVFNSPSQLLRFGKRVKEAGKSAGLRINPECSTQEGHAIYDPCAPGSRMGTTRAQWETAVRKHPELIGLLDGIHFHTLCEQDSSDLETTLTAVKTKFGDLISQMKWLNLGGGHHITRPGYDIARLEKCIEAAKEEGIAEVPCVYADHLTEAQKKAYILADNRMALDAGWDEELLSVEMQELQELGFDLSMTGFDEKELTDTVNAYREAKAAAIAQK